MKTILTTLAAAILAVTLGGAVQAGQPSPRHEPQRNDHRMGRDRDFHRDFCRRREEGRVQKTSSHPK